MRSGVKVAVIGGVFIVCAGGIGYGAYNVYNGITGGSGSDSSTHASGIEGPGGGSDEVKTGPLSDKDITGTAKSFLSAWATGADASEVAQFTNAASEAAPVVTEFRTQAHVVKAVITPGVAVGAKVPFTVKATVSLDGKSKPWTYRSALTVVRGETTGRPLVDWNPAVIYPKLTRTNELVAGEAQQPSIEAVDRNGVVLTAEKYPSLAPILDSLRERYGEKAGGTPGIELSLHSDDVNTPDQTLLTLQKGTPGKLRTRLDATVQAAAEKAVKKYNNASVASVQPSTGDILAIANNPATDFNTAMQGTQAPGSTMKIITASMLIERGQASENSPAECTPDVRYYESTFHNDGNFSLPSSSTFAQAFARSCNTAFIKRIDDVDDDGALAAEARDVFGIGLDWKTGVVSVDGSVPPAEHGVAAAQYIGQGTVQMNPLNMASVAATAKSGSFKQPILVPQSLDDRPLATAKRSLPYSVAQQVRDMMRLTATSGTAAQAMSALGGDKGAKTGSAEVDGQATSNSWFTAFQNDMAAAAVVQVGGHGADAAGPIVASVLGSR